MPIGAVVVMYNTPGRMLSACIKNLQKKGISDIAIINNNHHNRGFAAAANLGAGQLNNSYLLFINPDAVLKKIFTAKRSLDHYANIGAVGLALYSGQKQIELASFGASVNLFSLALKHMRRPAPPPSRPIAVGWASAGALLVRRRAFEQIGGFDPQFFLYWEDVDLCRRLRARGWQILFDPRSWAVHQRGASLLDLDKKTALYDISADKYFHKHYPKPIWQFQRSARSLYRLFSPRVD